MQCGNIVGQGHRRSETLWRLSANVLTIPHQSRGLFEHGWVRRDCAQAVCTATRLVVVVQRGDRHRQAWSPVGRRYCRGPLSASVFWPYLSRDRAHATCIVARLVASCIALWQLLSSGRVPCQSETQRVFRPYQRSGAALSTQVSSTDRCVRIVHMPSA